MASKPDMDAETITVLFVDDERSVLYALKRLLIREPYQKCFAQSGHEALETLKTTPAHVVVADMRMPEMDGLTLLRAIKREYPEMIRLALTAVTSAPQLLASINSGEVYRYLTKPLLPPDEIIFAVRQAIEVYRLRHEQQELISMLTTRNEELRQAMEHIRALRGIGPICATCKKVRDEEGRWNDVETYIRKHNDAQPPHRRCPECSSHQQEDTQQGQATETAPHPESEKRTTIRIPLGRKGHTPPDSRQ